MEATQRTYKKSVEANHTARHLSPAQIREEKNIRAHSRNEERKNKRMLAAVARSGKICEKGHKPNIKGFKSVKK